MRILLINPNLIGLEYIPFGLASLSAILKKNGHSVFLLDGTWGRIAAKKVLRSVEETRPDVIGFSVLSGDFQHVANLAKEIKKYTKLPILLGGIHPTVAPEESIAQDGVDMIAVGECDQAILDFASKLDAGDETLNVPNFWIKRGQDIQRNQLLPLVFDLDSLPFPDRHLFAFERYLEARNGDADIMASRGCPWACTYCINSYLRRLYQGKGPYLRFRSPEAIVSEIKYLLEQFCVKSFSFQDDTFTCNRSWLEEFASEYGRNIRLPYRCNARAEDLTDELCEMLVESGCATVFVGVESGDEEARRRILGRGASNDQIRVAFENARRAGLKTVSYNMVGSPYENKESLWKTVELNREIMPDGITVSVFQPYPGTALREECREKDLLTTDQVPLSHQFKSIVRLAELTPSQVERFRRRFRFHVYRKEHFLHALLELVEDTIYPSYMRWRAKTPAIVRNVAAKLHSALLRRQM